MAGLYIHIPFCVRKCLYCDFYSVEPDRAPPAERLRRPAPDQPAFLDALRTELEGLPDGFAPETIFIGGGTPTELSDRDFRRLLSDIRDTVCLDRLTEWSCESNPGTLSRANVEALLRAGVTRVSLGVQSFDDRTLEFLGRIHTAEEAEAGIQLLRDAGIRNINLDLIFGIPGAPADGPLRDAERAIALHPEHIAVYCLTIEDGTPFADMKRRGLFHEVRPGRQSRQYAAIRSRLRRAGYEQYEISNFARPGFRCRHNELYWTGGPYLGCGPAAHSHWDGARWSNPADLTRYITDRRAGAPPAYPRDILASEARARERLVFGLRHLDGVDRRGFREETGADLLALGGEPLRRHLEAGRLRWRGDRLCLAPRALFCSDAVFADLI